MNKNHLTWMKISLNIYKSTKKEMYIPNLNFPISYLPISTSLTLKRKRHMYYIPMDFEKLTLDGLIDTGALTSAISEQDLNKIKLLAN